MQDCSLFSEEIKAFTNTISEAINNKTEPIKSETEAEADKISRENPMETGIFFKIEVTWNEKPVSFDVPSVTVRDTPISFDVPTMTMRDKDIIFHLPECRMERRVVGRYPEFHGPRIVWRDIITEVPVCDMKEQRIVMGIPEIEMKRQDMILGIPVFDMQRVEIKMKYPEFKFVNVSVELKEKGNKLQTDTEEKIETSMSEVKSELIAQFTEKHTKLFDCYRSNILENMNTALPEIDATISGLNASISSMKEKNVPADNEFLVQSETRLKEMVAMRSEIEEKFKPALDALNESQKKSLEEFVQKFNLKVTEPVPV
ncbi:hypothetical protein T3H97_06265 [Paenibacillus sp. LX16]|uniref:hypothetical protein n=1 Tax=Paenibacillus sp. LX16 TaxID=1740264 RepID=UPI002E2C9CE6|nr:hypothetical protein [Paenibacillus sp. LX16]